MRILVLELLKKYHLQAVEKAELFRLVMENMALPVDQQISKARALTIAKSKQKLNSIIETIIYAVGKELHCMDIVMIGSTFKMYHMLTQAILLLYS